MSKKEAKTAPHPADKEPVVDSPDGGMVTVEQYNALLSKLEQLTNRIDNNEEGIIDLEFSKEHECTVRSFKDKYVVAFSTAWDVPHPHKDGVVIPRS